MAHSTTPSLTEQIHEAENRLLQAQKNSDVSALDRLLHDDLVFIAPNNEITTKKSDLDMHRSGNLKVLASHAEEPLVKIQEDLATVVVDVHLRVEFYGQPFEGLYRYMRVWKAVGNDWKIIAGSCSQL
ncbi:nuclear transport factor 2 family protein [Flavobacterium sp.]|uniref:nuclear transport factor 2 family protein n=1 Tax=Flavobacterium sp. TaxID=239 RepID=UPI0039E47969